MALRCDGVRAGPFRTRRGPVQPRDALVWDAAAGCCRSMSTRLMVRFASGGFVPRVCCESGLLQKAEWFGMARAAGLQPPTPVA